MRSKKLITLFLFSMCFSLVSPVFAANGLTPLTEVPKAVLAKQIETRLIEIKKMDKSDLTVAEKKELKKEVKDLRKQAKQNGIYLSVGAIIIIILLLILIL